MALDLGERRIGLAVSYGENTPVLPAGHLVRGKLADDVSQVLDMARQRSIGALVVGLPLTLSGEVGVQAKRAQGFVRAVRKRSPMPVYTVDETFTTVEAEGLLRDSGSQPSRDRGTVDSVAAALILQRFLAGAGQGDGGPR